MINRVLADFAWSFLAALLWVSCAGAQAQTSPPTPAVITRAPNSEPCPSGFSSPGGAGNPSVCYQATATCPNANTPSLGLVYSYVMPTTPPMNNGVIVFFSGAGGQLETLQAVNAQFALDYYKAGFGIVEVAWDSAWEQTSDSLGILTAACRPAGFLSYIYRNYLLPIRQARNGNPTAGMCAQGISAGSGAAAYSLVWYQDSAQPPNQLSADLDNVELESGPVFSDIDLGCDASRGSQIVSICQTGQFGCSTGTTPWTAADVLYVYGNLVSIRQWTNDPTCGNAGTTARSNQQWTEMSIVNGSAVNGTLGNFTYPNVGMAGWLCASSTSNCTPSTGCPNNSAAEGQEFYNQFTSKAQVSGYVLTGITGCSGPEGVADGMDPDNSPPNQTGAEAIEAHMKKQCTHPTAH